MTLPGRRLRAIARRVCHPTTMERVVDPLIADLQCEYADAIRRGDFWCAVRVRLAGYVGFWRTLFLQMVVGRSWDAVDYAAVRRICVISILATVTITALLVLPPLLRTSGQWFGGRLILYLMPQAIPLSLPVGLTLGILCGLRGAVTPRLRRTLLLGAVMASALSFVTLAWVVPEANQAFRSLVARELGGQLEPGPNELPLLELSKRIEAMDPFNPATASLRFTYHVRYAISIAPLVLSLLAFGVSAVTRRRAVAIASGVAAAVSYVAAFFLMDAGVQTAPSLRIVAAWLPDAVFSVVEATQPAAWLPIAAAWLPNVGFAATAAILLKSGSRARFG
jgi:lipopolysaccharide export LptBFGC system permease protein LptF